MVGFGFCFELLLFYFGDGELVLVEAGVVGGLGPVGEDYEAGSVRECFVDEDVAVAGNEVIDGDVCLLIVSGPLEYSIHDCGVRQLTSVAAGVA